MEKDLTPYEIDTIMEYWQDVSQDPQYISSETNIDLNVVVSILKLLQSEGKIKFDMKDNILKFNEMVHPEVLKSLKIGQKDKSKYFFNKKRIDRIYDAIIFDVVAYSMEMDGDTAVRIDCLATVKGKEYPFIIEWTIDDEVYYGSKEGKAVVENLRRELGDNINRFDQTTLKILNENLPEDFWQYRSQHN